MATRALLYRRPHEPKTLVITHGSQFFAIRLRRHRRARRYTLRIHPSDREAILTIPPRGTLAEAKDFAQRHGAWIAARLGRLPKAAPFQPGTVIPLRGTAHRIVHRAGTRGTVWTEVRDSGERILCVAGGVEHVDRRVSDFLKREARHDLQRSAEAYAVELGVRVKRLSIRDQSSPLGLLHLGRLAVVLLAPDPRAALRARLPRRARGRPSRRDEPLGAVLARLRKGLPVDGARQEVARYARQRPAPLWGRGLILVAD
ncbi:putative metal-dependent hydrolase [Bradyrhizobium sp. i1.4.4]